MENKLDFLTTAELMDLLQVSRDSIVRWRKEGLPFHRVGRLIRFNPEEVLEWVEGKTGNNTIEVVHEIKKQLKELDELLLREITPPEDLVECETYIYTTENKMLSGIKLTDDEIERYRTTLLNLNDFNSEGLDRMNRKVDVLNRAKTRVSEYKKPIDMDKVRMDLLDIDLRRS